MTKTKILLGLVIMALIQIIAGQVAPSFEGSHLGPGSVKTAITLQACVTAFVGAFAGGWVARRRFLMPSLVLWAFIWLATIYVLYSIAAPAGQSLLSVIQYNLVAIVLSGAATALGAASGQLASGRRSRGSAAAT